MIWDLSNNRVTKCETYSSFTTDYPPAPYLPVSPPTTNTTHCSWRGMWLAKRFGVVKAARTLHNVRPDLQEPFQLHFKMWHKKFSLIRRRKMLLIRGNKGGLIMNSYSSAAACVPKMLFLIEMILRRVQRGARIIILAPVCHAQLFFLATVESAYIPGKLETPWFTNTALGIPEIPDAIFCTDWIILALSSHDLSHLLEHHNMKDISPLSWQIFTPSPAPSCVFCEDLELWE